MRDDILYLNQQALTSNCVSSKHFIHQDYRRSDEETHSDIIIWGLWEYQTDTIIDVRFGVHGWVNSWITIAVARYYYLMITLQDRETDWYPVLGLILTQ